MSAEKATIEKREILLSDRMLSILILILEPPKDAANTFVFSAVESNACAYSFRSDSVHRDNTASSQASSMSEYSSFNISHAKGLNQ